MMSCLTFTQFSVYYEVAMSSYIDLKYINEISARLSQFKKKGDYLFNFRCPHCRLILKNLKLKQEHIFTELKMICSLNATIVI